MAFKNNIYQENFYFHSFHSLFISLCFVNDLEAGVERISRNFADDIKSGGFPQG